MKLLSITETAAVLNCSRQWVWVLIKMDKLKARKIGNTYVNESKAVESLSKSKNPTTETTEVIR